ncbi:ribokinase [Edaphobacter acidisoli]|uniref:Ribokinase n=1 Tax=Edaphobacter acidisoli TaxID=2040573 RepID=A0A916RSX9_9BACT|nr:ribokinase [Edaphobacter acidisoli]GGA67449.1 ribokinase [Edaphobacter acidisoli]
MQNSKPIIVVGSINTDLVSVTERMPLSGETVLGSDFNIYPGGKGANQAVSVARLGYPVRMIGRVGSDSFGREAHMHLNRAGVDTELVETNDGPSGIAVICVAASGDNSIIVTPGANATLTPAYLEQHYSEIRNAGAVLAQLEIPLDTVEYLGEICSREGIPFILDPAPAATLSDGLFKHVTWLTPNLTEATFYAADGAGAAELEPRSAVRRLQQKGAQGVLLKLGQEGVVVGDRDGRIEALPAFDVRAVDTTAAGDAFNGGFAVGLMKGKSAIESARFATAVAGISVTRPGAQPSMPTLKEVEQFIAEQSVRVT